MQLAMVETKSNNELTKRLWTRRIQQVWTNSLGKTVLWEVKT